MKEDSGVKEQYSRTSIFERIYQHCTTREQIAFTLDHHHTTTSDNSRLPENMPRPCIQVLSEQKNPDICSGAATGEVFSSFEQLRFKTLQLLVPNSKRLGGYTQWIPRSATRFCSRKHSDDACSCSTRLEGTRRGFQNSTMKCSGACRS